MTPEERYALEQEARMKEYAAARGGGSNTLGMLNECASTRNRPVLRDRIKKQLVKFDEDSARMSRLNELYELLERNQEVARILELLEDAGV